MGVANTLILEHNSSILLFDDFLKVLGCLSIGVLRQSFHNLDLSFISKILPSFREIILTLQVFWPQFKKIVQVILADPSCDVNLVAEVEMSPKCFLENGGNPNRQILTGPFVDPLRWFNQRFACVTLSHTILDRLLEGLVVGYICHQVKEGLGTFHNVRIDRQRVIILLIRCYSCRLE